MECSNIKAAETFTNIERMRARSNARARTSAALARSGRTRCCIGCYMRPPAAMQPSDKIVPS